MKFLHFKPNESSSSATAVAGAWRRRRWQVCTYNPRTLSFDSKFFKTTNAAVVLDEDFHVEHAESSSPSEASPDKYSDCPSLKTLFEESETEPPWIPSKIEGTQRLFFHPVETSSILEEAKISDFNAKILEVDSINPVLDFRGSMIEMVNALELKDWEGFEKLLDCYLRVNEERNHEYIKEAFVDLVRISAIEDYCFSSQCCCFSSPVSSSCSSCSGETSGELALLLKLDD